ncbi:MAG: hypothetical protein HY962_15625 [Ignavibacteriae bacterium]|nr:hypothetical protein [Ignavibacteriota bacterium]
MNSRPIFRQWLPLATTWLMMSAEGPFLAAVIARLVDPKENLAAYGVAFSFALIMEAPIIMMMSAATALVKDGRSYRRLRNFSYALNGLITLVMLLFLLPPVFDTVAIRLIDLPEHVARLTHMATLALLPWPAAIGFRRFYQGILISRRLTKYVAYGTVVRISTMGGAALLLAQATELPGAALGGLALSSAVVIEAVLSRFITARSIRDLRVSPDTVDPSTITYPAIARFYIPLALTSLLALGVQPMITFFIGQSRMALESLAVLPVINALVFVFRSFGLSFQEVAIANIGARHEGLPALRRFATVLALSAAGGLSLIAFTPLASWWLGNVSGLPPDLAAFALIPLRIQTLIPAASVLLAFQHALLVHARTTTPITWGTGIEVTGIILILVVAVPFLDLPGAVAAACALLIGRAAANVFLIRPSAVAAA